MNEKLTQKIHFTCLELQKVFLDKNHGVFGSNFFILWYTNGKMNAEWNITEWISNQLVDELLPKKFIGLSVH